jgi:NADPH:quinone reductase-like Zn-dependent oxidoreductase
VTSAFQQDLTMQAMVYQTFGDPSVIRETDMPMPTATPGHLVVRVAAASVNPADWKSGAGLLQGLADFSLPFVPGLDFAGVVAEVGDGVTEFKVGDRVFGVTALGDGGAYAEFVAASVDSIAFAPRSIPLATSAAAPLAALTPWGALFSEGFGDVQAGQSMLIHGAAGGVGSLAVQLARQRGAHVIATASRRNHSFLRGLGADHLIDYHTARFEDVVAELDVVIDLVGGDLMDRSMKVLRRNGALVCLTGLPDHSAAARLGVRASFLPGYKSRSALAQVSRLIDDGSSRSWSVKWARCGTRLKRLLRAGRAMSAEKSSS